LVLCKFWEASVRLVGGSRFLLQTIVGRPSCQVRHDRGYYDLVGGFEECFLKAQIYMFS
jgi:hypothetical protein